MLMNGKLCLIPILTFPRRCRIIRRDDVIGMTFSVIHFFFTTREAREHMKKPQHMWDHPPCDGVLGGECGGDVYPIGGDKIQDSRFKIQDSKFNLHSIQNIQDYDRNI